MKTIISKVKAEGVCQFTARTQIEGVEKIIYDYRYYIEIEKLKDYIDLKGYYDDSVKYDYKHKVYYTILDNQSCPGYDDDEALKVILDISDIESLLKQEVKPVITKFEFDKLSLNYSVPAYIYLLQSLDKLGYVNYNEAGVYIDYDVETSLEAGTFVFTSSYLSSESFFNITVGRKLDFLFIVYDNGMYNFTVYDDSTTWPEKSAVDDLIFVAKLFISLNEKDLSFLHSRYGAGRVELKDTFSSFMIFIKDNNLL